MSSPRGVLVPAAKPPEFRRRAVDLARSGQHPVAKVAANLGILKRASAYFARENVLPK